MAPSMGNYLRVLFIMVACLSMISGTDPIPSLYNSSSSNNDTEYVSGPIEILFSFDTTGSMYSVLQRVRTTVAEMIHRLQSDIPGIRMAVLAHGDYEDCYVTEFVDMTTDAEMLRKFVMDVEATQGGDSPEAYEEVLRVAASNISWTPGSQRSLVMIGDAAPHEPEYYANTLQTDWRVEAHRLADMGVKIYSIKALNQHTQYFYEGIANITSGYYLTLNSFDNIFDFIMAISYREYGLEYLKAYQQEVEIRLGNNIPIELVRLFETLKATAGNTMMSKSGKRIERIPWILPIVEPPVAAKPKLPKFMSVDRLRVQSHIAYRFATTEVTALVANSANFSQEAFFIFQLPKAAFISNFTMIINGIEYPGEVKEKEEAKIQYEEAKEKGEAAAHVTAVAQRTNSFKVAVNLPAEEEVTYKLLYQELLERRMGFYDHKIHVDAGQPVEDFILEVNIHETRDLAFVEAQPIKDNTENVIFDDDSSQVSLYRPATNKANIRFSPSVEEQRSLSEYGFQGYFSVKYDVVRGQGAGEIEVMNGYFVHYIAPEGLPVSNKNVLFVLDMSGSMHGTKMRQLKDAMATILKQLQPGDYFNVMGFSSLFRYWVEDGLRLATPQNVENATDWVENMISIGATYISGALERGLNILNAHVEQTSTDLATMLVFLTDGQPTVGERDTRVILDKVRTELNLNQFTIFSLGFGNDIDYPFLKELALQTNGCARRIYADSDATLQLQNFYNEIASPVLSNVQVTYIDEQVDLNSVTKHSYKNYFDGSEIGICGVISDNEVTQISTDVYAESVSGGWSKTLTVDVVQTTPLETERPSANVALANLERLWAYLTIKDILDKVILTQDAEAKAALNERALELSLKYHFVTPLTSMVVTKPEEEAAQEGIQDPDEMVPPSDAPGGGEDPIETAPGAPPPDYGYVPMEDSDGRSMGSRGPIGRTGSPGPMGPMGPMGPVGAKRPPYEPAPTAASAGFPAPRGEAGTRGDRGERGEIGERGLVGPVGPREEDPPGYMSPYPSRRGSHGSAGGCSRRVPIPARPPYPPVDPYPRPPIPVDPYPPTYPPTRPPRPMESFPPTWPPRLHTRPSTWPPRPEETDPHLAVEPPVEYLPDEADPGSIISSSLPSIPEDEMTTTPENYIQDINKEENVVPRENNKQNATSTKVGELRAAADTQRGKLYFYMTFVCIALKFIK